MLIRVETEADREAVYGVNLAAFGTPSEAELVDVLRREARPLVSLLAEVDGDVVGHILFSPVSLTGHPGLKVMGLAPMAVVPGHQGKGIGSALARTGLEHCRRLAFSAVVVLGHPDYYPRFGFLPASRFGIDSRYDVPEGVFMALELEPGGLSGRAGRIEYHPAFDAV